MLQKNIIFKNFSKNPSKAARYSACGIVPPSNTERGIQRNGLFSI